MTIQENALTDIRVEWLAETTIGETPSNPDWNKFSDYFASVPGWDGNVTQAENNAVGSGDIVDITRGVEEHALTLEYWLQRFPTSGNTIQDPIAEPFLHDYQTEYPSHTVEWRRETGDGGNFGGGIRQYTVAQGARPFSATIPGDPGEASPQAAELGYDEVEYVRSHVLHQPSSGNTITPQVVSTSSSDTFDVTIESEGASTTDDVTLNGTTPVTSGQSFSDFDVVWANSEPEGDISVTDGSGSNVLDTDLAGTNTDGVIGERGLPPLGTGSHASDLGTDPERFIGLNTKSTFGGSDLADRVHQFDLTAEIDSDTNAQQGTRRPAIDEGVRTVTSEADLAGPFASTTEMEQYLRGQSGDIVYTLGGTSTGSGEGDITVTATERTEVDEQSFGASDANFIFGVTFTAVDSNGDGTVVTMNNTG